MADRAAVRSTIKATEELQTTTADLDRHLKSAAAPLIVRGIASDWPLVRAGIEEGGAGARAYLLRYALDRRFEVNIGEPGQGGRLFYDDKMAMNFRMGKASLISLPASMPIATSPMHL
jgi:hypothetical protein